MKDFFDLIQLIEAQQTQRQSLAIAQVIAIEGNSFRRIGMRLLITAEGQWFHAQESGVFSGALQTSVNQIFKQQTADCLSINTASADGRSIGIALGYRGTILLFVKPIITTQALEHYRSYVQLQQASVLATIIKTNDKNTDNNKLNKIAIADSFHIPISDLKNISTTSNTFTKALYDGALACWNKGRLSLVTIDMAEIQVEVCYEILSSPPQLIIFGGLYDTYPLALMAKNIGWRVGVVAQASMLRQSLVNMVDQVIDPTEIKQLTTDNKTAYILMSHNFELDMQYLINAIASDVPFIGMLGPHKRFSRMFTQLADQGIRISQADQKRIFAPVGLDIGASTQEEMAVSIVAEISAFFNNRTAGHLKSCASNIHHR